MKPCRICGDALLFGENWYPSSAKRHDYICKKCLSEQCAANYRKNLPQRMEWRAKYYAEHRAEACANARAWRRENPERARAADAAKYRKHQDRIAAQHREYYQKNREKILARSRIYQRENMVEWTPGKRSMAIRGIGYLRKLPCSECGKYLPGKMQIHHDYYDATDPSAGARSVCVSCHIRLTWRTRRAKAKS